MKLNELVHTLDQIQRGSLDDRDVLIKTPEGHRVLKDAKMSRSGSVVLETAEYEAPKTKPSDE